MNWSSSSNILPNKPTKTAVTGDLKWDESNKGWKWDTQKETHTRDEEDYIAVVFCSSQGEWPSFEMLCKWVVGA